MSKIYIHYGSKRFRPKLFKPIRNRDFFNKPDGGLWASAVDAEYGWKQWCEDEDYCECNDQEAFRFTLADGANVVHIRDAADLTDLPKTTNPHDFTWVSNASLDFEKMLADGVDAIELKLSDNWQMYWDMYGWDCDCILVLNPDVVQEIRA